MTTSINVEKHLSAKAAGFRFVNSDDLAVVSVIARRVSQRTSLSATLRVCWGRFEEVLSPLGDQLSKHRAFLYVASPPSFEQNVLSRHRGIWGTDGLGWLPQDALRSPSVEVEGEQGIRFAGLAVIGAEQHFEALEFSRTHRSSSMFLSSHQELSEEQVRTISSVAFPQGEALLDWSSLLDQIGDGDELFLRAVGGFDDLEVSIDGFLANRLLQRLGAS